MKRNLSDWFKRWSAGPSGPAAVCVVALIVVAALAPLSAQNPEADLQRAIQREATRW